MDIKLDILAFGAHPDDVELGAGATIAKEVALGKKVGIIDLTRGELGTRGTAKTRAEEAAKAIHILGGTLRENLSFADGFFQNNRKHQIEIIKKIRAYRPDIVLCNAPFDRHIDHGKGAALVKDACFLSGLVKIDTHQEVWRPKYIFQYIQWYPIEPDIIVDVSDFMEIKKMAVEAYSTQLFDPKSKEPKTPISNQNFLESVSYRAKDLGRLIGSEYGEGFVCSQPMAVNSLRVFT